MTDNPSQETILERSNECLKVCQSFEYFLDKYVWIEDKANNQPIKLHLWDSQRAEIPAYLIENLVIILKAHQLGYTWIFVAAYTLWLSITTPLHQTIVNSFSEDVGIEILKRVVFILDRIPDWLYPPVGKKTTTEIEFLHTDHLTGLNQPSEIQVIPATEKGGQSKTPNVLIIDESAQNRYVRRTYEASEPGITMAKGKIVIISNSIKDAPGWGFTRQIYSDSMKGFNDFHRVFLPWWANPLRPANFKELTLRKIDEETFKQRYPETEEEAVSAMSGSYFGDTLARHDEFIREHDNPGITGYLEEDPETKKIRFVQDPRGLLTVWRKPYYLEEHFDGRLWIKRYSLGSDVSEGLGRSYSGAYILDRRLDEFVARLRSNRLDAVQWAEELYLLSKWYKSVNEDGKDVFAVICAEITGAGQTTVKELQKKNPPANQYVRIIPGKIGGNVTKQIGWQETDQSKQELCGDLKKWFRDTRGGFYCPILVDEASTTIKHEGSRKIGPEDSTKQWDMVVAAGCTIQAGLFLGEAPRAIGDKTEEERIKAEMRARLDSTSLAALDEFERICEQIREEQEMREGW
jgi:hypothetical protein